MTTGKTIALIRWTFFVRGANPCPRAKGIPYTSTNQSIGGKKAKIKMALSKIMCEKNKKRGFLSG